MGEEPDRTDRAKNCRYAAVSPLRTSELLRGRLPTSSASGQTADCSSDHERKPSGWSLIVHACCNGDGVRILGTTSDTALLGLPNAGYRRFVDDLVVRVDVIPIGTSGAHASQRSRSGRRDLLILDAHRRYGRPRPSATSSAGRVTGSRRLPARSRRRRSVRPLRQAIASDVVGQSVVGTLVPGEQQGETGNATRKIQGPRRKLRVQQERW